MDIVQVSIFFFIHIYNIPFIFYCFVRLLRFFTRCTIMYYNRQVLWKSSKMRKGFFFYLYECIYIALNNFYTVKRTEKLLKFWMKNVIFDCLKFFFEIISLLILIFLFYCIFNWRLSVKLT